METSAECAVQYSLSEVRKHDSPDDLWLILYNKVYDVTELTKRHPGGAEVILDCGGVDATEAFEDVCHSKVAFDMLTPHLVGRVLPADEKTYKTSMLSECIEKPTVSTSRNTVKKKARPSNKDQLSVGLLVTLLVLALVGIICIQKLKWASLVT